MGKAAPLRRKGGPMFCHNCGHQLLDGAAFCENCGAKVMDSAAGPVSDGTGGGTSVRRLGEAPEACGTAGQTASARRRAAESLGRRSTIVAFAAVGVALVAAIAWAVVFVFIPATQPGNYWTDVDTFDGVPGWANDISSSDSEEDVARPPADPFEPQATDIVVAERVYMRDYLVPDSEYQISSESIYKLNDVGSVVSCEEISYVEGALDSRDIYTFFMDDRGSAVERDYGYGSSYTLSYDEMGRPVSRYNPMEAGNEYLYGTDGSLTMREYFAGYTIDEPRTLERELTFDAAGYLSDAKWYKNGEPVPFTVTSMTDEQGRIVHQEVASDAVEMSYSYSYEYDEEGRIAALVMGDMRVEYEYVRVESPSMAVWCLGRLAPIPGGVENLGLEGRVRPTDMGF